MHTFSKTKKRLGLLVHDAWRVGLAVLLVFAGLEALETGFVSRFFDMDLLVLFLFALSVILLMTGSPRKGASPGAIFALQAVGVAAAAAVWTSLPAEIGVHWRALAAGGALFLAALSWPLIKDI